jgi:hypothetical protein
MANPEIRIHDLETGEIVDREMTDEELAEWEQQEAAWLASRPAEEAE